MDKDLVLNNINLIHFVINRMGLFNQREYYYDIGSLGLARAAYNYDSSKGYTFSTFATRCIRNEILMDIRYNKKYDKTISLDETVSDDENTTLMDIIPVEHDMDECLMERDEIKKLYEALSMLNPIEQEIMLDYYKNEMSQAEIAKIHNLSQSIISRKIKLIIKKLQNIMIDSKERMNNGFRKLYKRKYMSTLWDW